VLILSFNRLSSIPAGLFRPTSGLRVLDVSHNELRSLPNALFGDGGMERLALAHNRLTDLPLSSLGPAAAATLRELHVASNSILSLNSPDVLSQFKVSQAHTRTAVTSSEHIQGVPEVTVK
jgi:Leucine-rich repeat (LRR) protein